jgi:hypothetical protein
LPSLPVIFPLCLSDRPPCVDHHQQNAGVFAFYGGLAMRDQNIAGEPDQMVAVIGSVA